jgi:hypothetical protein
MVNINEFKIYCDTLANIDQTGNTFTPNQFNSVLPNNVNSLVEQYYGKPKWAAMPFLSNERTQAIKDYIANSEINISIKPIVTEGVLTLPDDYLHLQALQYEYYTSKEVVCIHCGCNRCVCQKLPKGFITPIVKQKYKKSIKTLSEITIINNGQWSQIYNDPNLYPTTEYPYAQFTGSNTLEIAPQEITKVTLRYLRYPKKAVWGYNIANGIAVYDPNASQNIELPEILIPELAAIQLESCSIHTREYWMQTLYAHKNVTGT